LSPLNKKLLRDLVTHRAQIAAIIVVVALGIVMFAAPLLAQRDLRDSTDDIYRRTRYEDFSAQVGTAPAESVAALGRIDNVKAVEGRQVREVLAEMPDGDELTLRVITVPDRGRPEVNDLIVESGRYLKPGESGAALAEHHLVSQFDLKPGSVITLLKDGKRIPLRVAGSVVSPEYLRLISRSGEFAADPSQFGVVFLPYSEAERIFGSTGEVNDYRVRVSDPKRLEETMESTGALLEPYSLVGLTTGADEPSAIFLNMDISNMGKLALFFTILLLGVAALAIYITMTLIVFSQQRQIGVSRALGYSRGSIVAHYLGYGVMLGAAGSVIGVIGAFYLSKLFVNIYADRLALPLVTTSLYGGIVSAGAAIGILFAVLGALVPAVHAVRMKPAEAMWTEAGVSLGVGRHHRKKKSLMDRLGFPEWLRVTLRNLWRNRRRTILTCLGVIATLSLLVTATGGKDSLNYVVDKSLNGVIRWDAAALFTGPAGAESLERIRNIDGVTYAEPSIDAPARISAAGKSTDVQVQAYLQDTSLHGIYPTRGSTGRPGPGQIVLNRGISKTLPVKIGDTITLDTRLGSLPFKVAGFVAEPLGGICYVDLEYLQQKAGSDLFNVVVARVAPGKEQAVASAMRSVPGVSRVIEKQKLLTVLRDLVDAVKTMFIIFYIMAFAMGFAILFSMITVNLLERRREIATVRTLGAGRRRIFAFVTAETVTVVLVALVPGILLGRLLELFAFEVLLKSARLAPDSVISGVTLIVIVVASLAVMILSELPSIRWLYHLDLAKVTKERAD